MKSIEERVMKYVDSEKLIAEIEKRMEERNDVRTVDDTYWPESDFWTRDKEDDEILYIIASLQQEEPGVWIKIDAEHPLPFGQEVIGYNKEWVHEDFNPSGTRIGFLSGTGFISAKWNNDQDFYSTCSEEGDDYTVSQILPDGTRKTWCKYENGEAVEGYLPNMPTHFMLIPETPDGFAWPYGKEFVK